MLQLSNTFLGKPVLSLRTGGQIAVITEMIINPNNLKIEGFYCEDRFNKSQLVLVAQDIRDQIDQGIVVNDHEVLVDAGELIRLKSVLKLRFAITGKPVVTVNKHRLGKITDFAVDDQTLYVQKLYVGQSVLKSLSIGSLSIDRSQIVEITDSKIIVQEPLKPVKVTLSGAPAAS
ncbi:MAG: hypothetical protein ABI354_00555 [Candidatus Saccharimonadales bacterium]